MDLSRAIEYIRGHEKELVVFNATDADGIVADLEAFFETYNVRIRATRTASGAPSGIAVLTSNDGVLSRVDVSMLRELLDRVPAGSVGIADGEFEPVLAPLKETTFTSYDREQLLYASREIEDRARRVGGGTIHAGFQRVSLMTEQRSVYADLDGRGVEVHTYGLPDARPPDLGGGRVHTIENDEIATHWFVVFDGDGDDAQKTALIAEQVGDDEFFGTWTYDPVIVDHVLEHLERTYLPEVHHTARNRDE